MFWRQPALLHSQGFTFASFLFLETYFAFIFKSFGLIYRKTSPFLMEVGSHFNTRLRFTGLRFPERRVREVRADDASGGSGRMTRSGYGNGIQNDTATERRTDTVTEYRNVIRSPSVFGMIPRAGRLQGYQARISGRTAKMSKMSAPLTNSQVSLRGGSVQCPDLYAGVWLWLR
jgi:hypothetical protein